MSKNCTRSLSMRFAVTAVVACHTTNMYLTISIYVLVCQLKAHKKVDDHPNIIRFLGLCKGQYIITRNVIKTVNIDDLFSKIQADADQHYHMVFEFADG